MSKLHLRVVKDDHWSWCGKNLDIPTNEEAKHGAHQADCLSCLGNSAAYHERCARRERERITFLRESARVLAKMKLRT